jgi:hypothetical protein
MNWENNSIQFPRLIAEMEAAGFFEQSENLNALLESMDLEMDDLAELIERASTVWDSIVEGT